MIEIPMPYLTVEDICQAVRTWCNASEEMVNSIDFSRMPRERITPMEAKQVVLLSWSFLTREDRPFIFPCPCCIFVPHVHDNASGCGPSLVFTDEWKDGDGHPKPMIEGVGYHFGAAK